MPRSHDKTDGAVGQGPGTDTHSPAASTGPAAVLTSATAASDRGAAALTVMRLFRALERVDSGLTPQQYRMLKMAGAGGERSARLAERLAVAKPTLTTTADGLVAAGLVHREPEQGDRRVVRLRLTKAGEAAVDRADAAYAGWLDALFEATGAAAQIRHDLELIDTAMTERRRTRLAGLAGQRDQAAEADQRSAPVSDEKTRALAAAGGPRALAAAGGPRALAAAGGPRTLAAAGDPVRRPVRARDE